ncbi:MAG: adenine phosphoribosyltransferase, partial [Verrucomicrobiales bacterium]|nr:adenine phosphoribosyltransferase [Verrucomicrobiales bacterium]
ELEYGSNTIAIHTDAVTNGQRVLLVDDLLATGGTAAAGTNLVAKAGGRVVESVFFIELGFLDGRAKMGDVPVRALVKY